MFEKGDGSCGGIFAVSSLRHYFPNLADCLNLELSEVLELQIFDPQSNLTPSESELKENGSLPLLSEKCPE